MSTEATSALDIEFHLEKIENESDVHFDESFSKILSIIEMEFGSIINIENNSDRIEAHPATSIIGRFIIKGLLKYHKEMRNSSMSAANKKIFLCNCIGFKFPATKRYTPEHLDLLHNVFLAELANGYKKNETLKTSTLRAAWRAAYKADRKIDYVNTEGQSRDLKAMKDALIHEYPNLQNYADAVTAAVEFEKRKKQAEQDDKACDPRVGLEILDALGSSTVHAAQPNAAVQDGDRVRRGTTRRDIERASADVGLRAMSGALMHELHRAWHSNDAGR